MSVCYGSVRGKIYRNVQPAFEPPEPEPEGEPEAFGPPEPRRFRERRAVACSNGRAYASVRAPSRDTGVSMHRIGRSMARNEPRDGLLFWDARYPRPSGSD